LLIGEGIGHRACGMGKDDRGQRTEVRDQKLMLRVEFPVGAAFSRDLDCDFNDFYDFNDLYTLTEHMPAAE
jgi:hypothetical protein